MSRPVRRAALLVATLAAVAVGEFRAPPDGVPAPSAAARVAPQVAPIVAPLVTPLVSPAGAAAPPGCAPAHAGGDARPAGTTAPARPDRCGHG